MNADATSTETSSSTPKSSNGVYIKIISALRSAMACMALGSIVCHVFGIGIFRQVVWEVLLLAMNSASLGMNMWDLVDRIVGFRNGKEAPKRLKMRIAFDGVIGFTLSMLVIFSIISRVRRYSSILVLIGLILSSLHVIMSLIYWKEDRNRSKKEAEVPQIY